MDERQSMVDNPENYLIVGDLDKPFDLCECECRQCEQWRTDRGRPTHAECRKIIKEKSRK